MKTLARILAPLALASAAFADGTPTVPGYLDTLVVRGLANPTAMAFTPDGRLLIAQQGGTIVGVDMGIAIPIGDVETEFCFDCETGVMGIAVDPNFASNGFVYIYRTKTPGPFCTDVGRVNEVIRVTLNTTDLTFDGSTFTVLLTGIRTDTCYHNGGCLRLVAADPDNGDSPSLYISTGEAGVGDFLGGPPGSCTNPYAQDLNALEGKILRINLNGSIPATNPFVGQAGKRGEIFSYGLRNPWRIGFDPFGKRLWGGDVGEEDFEELNLLASGKNYSWPLVEGLTPKAAKPAGAVDPLLVYPHSGTKSLGDCIVGPSFAGSYFGTFGGHLFFADFGDSVIYRMALSATRTKLAGKPTPFVTGCAFPVDLIFGPDGALYYLSFADGSVRRVGQSGSVGTVQSLPGKTLTLASGTAKKLSVQSAGLIALGSEANDPTVFGGSVRVVGTGFDDTYPLPASGWKLVGKLPMQVTGFSYKDAKLLNGPISGVTMTAGKLLKIDGKGVGLNHVIGATTPEPVTVILSIGARSWTMTFGGTVKFTPNKSFTATNAPIV